MFYGKQWSSPWYALGVHSVCSGRAVAPVGGRGREGRVKHVSGHGEVYKNNENKNDVHHVKMCRKTVVWDAVEQTVYTHSFDEFSLWYYQYVCIILTQRPPGLPCFCLLFSWTARCLSAQTRRIPLVRFGHPHHRAAT